MKIEYLRDHIGFARTVAKWLHDEFVCGIRDDISYEYVLSSILECNKQALPIRLVALTEGKCAGTASLVFNDLKCRDYTPWLAALYVEAGHRNQGIGLLLIDAVKDIARQLGYDKLYLRTEHASGYYRKLGWEFVETCIDSFNLQPDVFVTELG